MTENFRRTGNPVTIRKFTDAFEYASKLGLAGNGNMNWKQGNLAEEAERMLKASGQKSWHDGNFVPFHVRYNRENDRFDTWECEIGHLFTNDELLILLETARFALADAESRDDLAEKMALEYAKLFGLSEKLQTYWSDNNGGYMNDR